MIPGHAGTHLASFALILALPAILATARCRRGNQADPAAGQGQQQAGAVEPHAPAVAPISRPVVHRKVACERRRRSSAARSRPPTPPPARYGQAVAPPPDRRWHGRSARELAFIACAARAQPGRPVVPPAISHGRPPGAPASVLHAEADAARLRRGWRAAAVLQDDAVAVLGVLAARGHGGLRGLSCSRTSRGRAASHAAKRLLHHRAVSVR